MTNEKTSVAKSSLYGAIFITVLKLIVALWTGSLGILAEAAHSALDFLAAGVTLFAVKIADKPADIDHQYGHGKAENFAALVETLLLFVTCFWIISEAIERLYAHSIKVEISFWSFFVMIISIVVDYSRSRALLRVAKKYNNQALEADALHFSTDIWSSAVVITGLIFSSYHFYAADAIAAISVAVIVMGISYTLGKRTVDALMDKLPEGLYGKIKNAIQKISGVEKIISLRMRQAGPKIFLDTTVAIKRTLPFETAHAIVSDVEGRILTLLPNADVVVHADPVETADETLMEKIRLIISMEGMYPHHIRIFFIGNKKIADLHLEYSSDLNFVQAHEISEQVEKKICSLLPDINEVRIHLEEIFAPTPTIDITSQSETLVLQIKTLVKQVSQIHHCDNITIFQLENHLLKIALNCTFDATLSLDTVHAIVTTTENLIAKQIENLDSVLVHAEPLTKENDS
jgi:cation diffusion facilitator family transporter